MFSLTFLVWFYRWQPSWDAEGWRWIWGPSSPRSVSLLPPADTRGSQLSASEWIPSSGHQRYIALSLSLSLSLSFSSSPLYLSAPSFSLCPFLVWMCGCMNISLWVGSMAGNTSCFLLPGCNDYDYAVYNNRDIARMVSAQFMWR